LTIIDRVIARQDPPARQYRALRHLEAQSDKLGGSAWINAWTEVDPVAGFRYQIIGEGGSGFVRGKVLRPWLDGEKKMWTAGDPEQQDLTTPQDCLTPGLRFELSRDPLNQRHRSLLRATVRNPPPGVNSFPESGQPPSGTGHVRVPPVCHA
jgi:hypothetical protein